MSPDAADRHDAYFLYEAVMDATTSQDAEALIAEKLAKTRYEAKLEEQVEARERAAAQIGLFRGLWHDLCLWLAWHKRTGPCDDRAYRLRRPRPVPRRVLRQPMPGMPGRPDRSRPGDGMTFNPNHCLCAGLDRRDCASSEPCSPQGTPAGNRSRQAASTTVRTMAMSEPANTDHVLAALKIVTLWKNDATLNELAAPIAELVNAERARINANARQVANDMLCMTVTGSNGMQLVAKAAEWVREVAR